VTERTKAGIRAVLLTLWQLHRWSLPLSAASALFFARLGNEMSEGELDGFDAAMQHVVDGLRGHFDQAMLFMTRAGDVPPMTLLTLIVLIALMVCGRPREARFLLLGTLGSLLLNIGLKALFHRARPAAVLAYLLPVPDSLSFPSGHTMGATGVIGSLMIVLRVLRPPRLVYWSAAILGACFILGVAVSRVYLGAHYPSDVLGALLAEAAWLSALTGWSYPRLLPGESSSTRLP